MTRNRNRTWKSCWMCFTAASPSDERQGSVAESIVLQQETAEGLSAAASLDRSCRSIRLAAEGSSIGTVPRQ